MYVNTEKQRSPFSLGASVREALRKVRDVLGAKPLASLNEVINWEENACCPERAGCGGPNAQLSDHRA